MADEAVIRRALDVSLRRGGLFGIPLEDLLGDDYGDGVKEDDVRGILQKMLNAGEVVRDGEQIVLGEHVESVATPPEDGSVEKPPDQPEKPAETSGTGRSERESFSGAVYYWWEGKPASRIDGFEKFDDAGDYALKRLREEAEGSPEGLEAFVVDAADVEVFEVEVRSRRRSAG